MESELAACRAKRRLALAHAQANRGLRPQIDDIEALLDEELAEWMGKVERARLAYEHALAYRTSMVPMRKAAAEELRRVYRITYVDGIGGAGWKSITGIHLILRSSSVSSATGSDGYLSSTLPLTLCCMSSASAHSCTL